MEIKISSFNIYEFENGNFMLKQLCNDLDVILVQEHWLLPANFNLLSNCCDNFTGFSVPGCLDIKAYGKSGRPYGSIGVLWLYYAPFKCTVIDCNDSYRCKAAKIEGLGISLICITVYLPNSVNNNDNKEEILQCFAFIESMFNQYANSNSKCFLIGDF